MESSDSFSVSVSIPAHCWEGEEAFCGTPQGAVVVSPPHRMVVVDHDEICKPTLQQGRCARFVIGGLGATSPHLTPMPWINTERECADAE